VTEATARRVTSPLRSSFRSSLFCWLLCWWPSLCSSSCADTSFPPEALGGKKIPSTSTSKSSNKQPFFYFTATSSLLFSSLLPSGSLLYLSSFSFYLLRLLCCNLPQQQRFCFPFCSQVILFDAIQTCVCVWRGKDLANRCPFIRTVYFFSCVEAPFWLNAPLGNGVSQGDV